MPEEPSTQESPPPQSQANGALPQPVLNTGNHGATIHPDNPSDIYSQETVILSQCSACPSPSPTQESPIR